MTEKNNQVRFLFEANTWFTELNFNYDSTNGDPWIARSGTLTSIS